ncbi:hypothetical protein UA08_07428 [Talaromyces atroroseus]|uniref:LipA and NB-ARC domain protein n=1 Tax=Talaromyces atroroseus TaxID=1441469 RepID=A0A225AJK1_TALAT|nr:hypothetical protein UA08_07428 [Talaromyces atroroseus]OKL57338.1 hypothetical protein UA08_07428 [Talaromyces atroroseus]
MEQQEQGVVQRDVPPPPYRRENVPAQYQIRRKPIDTNKPSSNDGSNNLANGGGRSLTPSRNQAESLQKQIRDSQDVPPKPPPRPPRPGPPVPAAITDGNIVASPQSMSSSRIPSFQAASSSSNINASVNGTTAREAGDWKKAASGHAQKAFQEARHFVGGLVAHPTVSNKHYTILRHSHGVVFYQGSNTFLAISIFADEPLPKDRTIWMQCKGWSGKTGMRAKALFGFNDSWINVTPSLAIQPDQVNSSDERAWQRDIKRFRKKASGSVQRHTLRETAIVRVPVEAEDGYYQLVLCRGDQKRKVLCTSPVFRLISTSSDPSTLRGASLSTLPVELGLWVGGLYAQNTASNAISPVTTKIQDSAFFPSGTTQLAAQTAYTVSGLESRVDSGMEEASDHYSETQSKMLSPLGPGEIDAEAGPTTPYPVDFVAKLDVHAVISTFDANGFPRKISVVGISRNILPRLDGHYFAWCKILPGEPKSQSTLIGDKKSETSSSWLQCIFSASSVVFQERVSNVRSQRALKVTTSIKIIEDIDIPSAAQVQVRIMGFIRPPNTTSTSIKAGNPGAEDEEQIILDVCDIELVRSALDNPAWQADPVRDVSSTQRSVEGSEGEEAQSGLWDRAKGGYTNLRMKGQTMVGQIPFHRVGIRSPSDELKDKNLAVSGYYISR